MNSTGQLPPGCVAAAANNSGGGGPGPDDPRACFFSEHALRYTKTPVLLLNSLYNFMTWEILQPDPWSPGFPPPPQDWKACLAPGGLTTKGWAACSAAQRAIIRGFRADFLAAAAPALRPPHGAFLDSCPRNHEQNGMWGRLRIGNVTAAAAIAGWVFGTQQAYLVDDPFPSTISTC